MCIRDSWELVQRGIVVGVVAVVGGGAVEDSARGLVRYSVEHGVGLGVAGVGGVVAADEGDFRVRYVAGVGISCVVECAVQLGGVLAPIPL